MMPVSVGAATAVLLEGRQERFSGRALLRCKAPFDLCEILPSKRCELLDLSSAQQRGLAVEPRNIAKEMINIVPRNPAGPGVCWSKLKVHVSAVPLERDPKFWRSIRDRAAEGPTATFSNELVAPSRQEAEGGLNAIVECGQEDVSRCRIAPNRPS